MLDNNFPPETPIEKRRIEVIQINLGNKCNQKCNHCHISASPRGTKNMSLETAEKIVESLKRMPVSNVEFTGGTPELNPNLKFFLEELSLTDKALAVRTNLTVLSHDRYSFYIDLFKDFNVKLISSLPAVFQDSVDRQRGDGAFSATLKVLKRLNDIGYGTNGLELDLVYNPSSDYLPPDHGQLETQFKDILSAKHNIFFNRLITMVNSPLGKFKNLLKNRGRLNTYMELLKKSYNPSTLNNIMCRHLLSIDYQGYIYDCDFNLAANRKIQGYDNKFFWEIDIDSLSSAISFDDHCFACTANLGSSCHGELITKEFVTEKSVREFDVKGKVKYYYGEELKKTSDLKSEACCNINEIPEYIKDIIPLIDDEILMKYYGCGSPIPTHLNGLKVLDIGCGTGRDAYIISKLTGPKGFVCGLDMTENQLNLAKSRIKSQTERFGYKKPNISFIMDYMENIGQHFESESIDVTISNCVLNLAEDKEPVFRQIYDTLKYGGEFYFSDIYTDRRAGDEIRNNPLLYSECLGGALYFGDFKRLCRKTGFIDPRIISLREVRITNNEILKLTGNIRFYSATYRLWKLKGLEDACEDYGHIAIYKGGLPESPFSFQLDESHLFYKGKPEKVCGNTALMLSKTRYKDFFEVTGSFNEHFGEFKDCSNVENNPQDSSGNSSSGSSCC